MKKILIEFYYGRINPWETIVPLDPGYRRACKRAAALERSLLSRLNPEEQELYEKVTNEQRISADMEREETFAEGFRLGARMMGEGLGNY